MLSLNERDRRKNMFLILNVHSKDNCKTKSIIQNNSRKVFSLNENNSYEKSIKEDILLNFIKFY